MKRSEINQIIREMEEMAEEHGFHLPPFCRWTPEEWKKKGHEYDEIRDNMLGWDITDFGRGDFNTCGFGLITLRNGNQHNPKYKKGLCGEAVVYERHHDGAHAFSLV